MSNYYWNKAKIFPRTSLCLKKLDYSKIEKRLINQFSNSECHNFASDSIQIPKHTDDKKGKLHYLPIQEVIFKLLTLLN